jgi:hypothetical protein
VSANYSEFQSYSHIAKLPESSHTLLMHFSLDLTLQEKGKEQF